MRWKTFLFQSQMIFFPFCRGSGSLKFVSGSHKQFRRQDGRCATVPVHTGRDVSPVLLWKITDDIKLTVEERRENTCRRAKIASVTLAELSGRGRKLSGAVRFSFEKRARRGLITVPRCFLQERWRLVHKGQARRARRQTSTTFANITR